MENLVSEVPVYNFLQKKYTRGDLNQKKRATLMRLIKNRATQLISNSETIGSDTRYNWHSVESDGNCFFHALRDPEAKKTSENTKKYIKKARKAWKQALCYIYYMYRSIYFLDGGDL